jgi:hypothetical protein
VTVAEAEPGVKKRGAPALPRIVRSVVPQVTVSDELHKRAVAFKPVIEAVLEEEIDGNAAVEVVLERGLASMLNDLLEMVEPEVLLLSFHQLASQHPEDVYGFVADALRRGDAINRAKAKRQFRFGFDLPRDE